MGKRKDNKGRVLKQGESQRQNGTYDYRYTDARGKRCFIYAKTLDELRRKETEIQRDLLDGIGGSAGEITVAEMVDHYISLRRNLKTNSLRSYSPAINRLHNNEFGQRKICNVKKSDAMAYAVELHDLGLKYHTVEISMMLLRPAFEMAVDDDLIRKNPFRFRLCDILPNDAGKRVALTKEQQEQYLEMVKETGKTGYYDEIVILLHTALRVSELYGLTKADVDFDRRRIHINKQLGRTAEKPYFVSEPKTKAGIRYIPMDDATFWAFRRVIQNRQQPKTEMIVDGCAGFVFLDQFGRPKTGMHLQNFMRLLQQSVIRKYGSFPKVTPHVLRHTCCTNWQQAGIDVKSLQALMGHSNASVTLDIYSHVDYNAVERAFYGAASCL